MFDALKKIIKPKYPTLNRIELSARQIIANYNYLQSLQTDAAIFPVLKSNAYGHGLKEVATILNQSSAVLVAVDSFPEAQVLYHYFKRGVLILGEMPYLAYRYLNLARTEVVVYNASTLKYLTRFGKKIKIHLFINSGMNREGIKDLRSFLIKNKKYLDQVTITGICSHLASADQDSALTKIQESQFRKAVEILHSFSYFPRWIHLGNSAAVFKIHDKLLTAYRPGLALYGYHPFAKNDNSLQPALEVFSTIVSLQSVKAGETVSYQETYQVSQAGQIAVLPFGYFEGLDRRFSNRAQFLVQSSTENFFAQIAGQVCMNLSCLDVGQHPLALGDSVKIISKKNADPNSIINLSSLIDTIPYEVLVKLQSNIHRKIV